MAHEVGHVSMHAFTLAVLAHLEGDLGDTDSARAHARQSAAMADGAGATNLGIYSFAALGRAELAAEQPEEAAAALDEAARRRIMLGWREPGVVLDGADHVEALLRAGREDPPPRPGADGRPGRADQQGMGTAATERSRLLTADAADVDAHAREALAWHDKVDMPYERAPRSWPGASGYAGFGFGPRRGSRWAGRWRRSASWAPALGLRAERELDAAGVRPPEAVPSAPGREDLSTHELRIALMVAQGMTNREVAAALFLSPKTIEFHLSRIYRTLECAVTEQLARFLAQDQQAGPRGLTHPVPDPGQEGLLLVGQVVQVATADAVQVRLACLGEPLTSQVGDHGVHPAGVARTARRWTRPSRPAGRPGASGHCG